MSDLDAIRARANAATPGPWTLHEDGLIWPERLGDPICGLDDMQDAEFIAHAREDVPALLAERDAVRAQRTAEIVAALRAEAGRRDDVGTVVTGGLINHVAGMIERGEFDDLVAGDE